MYIIESSLIVKVLGQRLSWPKQKMWSLLCE